MNLKILILSEVLHPDMVGGAGRVAAELARHLVSLGCVVRLITRMTTAAAQPREERDGFTILRFPINTSTPWSVYQDTMRGTFECISRATADFRPDVVHIHQPLIGYHAMNCHLVKGIPMVYTFHSSWGDELKARARWYAALAGMAYRVERSVLARAANIITLSEYSRRRVLSLRDSAAISIVPGGVDLDAFPVKKKASGNTPVPVLLTIRNLVPRMGLADLIDASIMLHREGVNHELRIGGDGPLRKELERRAAPLGRSCRFLGRIPEEDLPLHFRDADLFVLPTIAIEGFGLVILEAFSSGTPVLGTPVGAIPEVAGLQGNGFITAGIGPRSLAEGIRNCLTRSDLPPPEFLRELAEGYSWRKRAEHVIDVYRRVLRVADGALPG